MATTEHGKSTDPMDAVDVRLSEVNYGAAYGLAISFRDGKRYGVFLPKYATQEEIVRRMRMFADSIDACPSIHSEADDHLGWTQEKEDDGTWKVCTHQAEEPNATEVNSLLIRALALLENVLTDSEGKDDQEKEEDEEYRMILTWAAHEHVQRAWNLYSGHDEPHQLSEVTRGCVAIIDACVAIEAREQIEAARKP